MRDRFAPRQARGRWTGTAARVTAAPYWELTVTAPAEVEDALSNFLWELGALGVVAEAQAGRGWVLRAFYPAPVEPAGLEARVREYAASLKALGCTPPELGQIAPLAERNWAEAWRDHFRPVAVGRRLLIAPPWLPPPSTERLVLRIEPGRAFGTGHHATTVGCLEALEATTGEHALDRALDLGTGTGILAIAAAALGVGRVLAVDEDPDAVAAAQANASLNRVADRVTCRLADVADLAAEPAPLVLANLLAGTHRRLAPHYARLVARQGRLVLGGLLDGETPQLAALLEPLGFRQHDVRSREGWTTLTVRREA